MPWTIPADAPRMPRRIGVMRIATWNINSLRARMDRVLACKF